LDNLITLALDVMSGDRDPHASVSASIDVLTEREDIHIHLIGNQEQIKHCLPNKIDDRITIHHTDEVITMKDSPMDVLRRKKHSSMRLAVEMVANNHADACVSSGNTGALLAISKYLLKTIPSISRPAIVKSIPTIKSFTYMLDLGANSNCSAEQLMQFAMMGSVIAQEIKGINKPKVALLNIGHERIKGHEVIQEAASLLEESKLNYIGFIEGNNIMEDIADVVVTDGFTGNIAVKTMEGSINMFSAFMHESFQSNNYNKLASIISKPAINKFKARIDPRRFNGGLLIGLNGVVVKSHGASDSFSFYHALNTAIDEVEKNIVSKLISVF
jgi:glycerol-3-phosphate acyltransferase PlsX